MNGNKRKVDELIYERVAMNNGMGAPVVKRQQTELEKYRSQLSEILRGKEDFIRKQRHSSLGIEPRRIDDDGIMARFAPLYQEVARLHTEKEEHAEHLRLIRDIINESIVVEWPRAVYGVHKSGHDEATEVDQAPLIHRARNVVKCRTSHPTMRIKIYALASSDRGSSANVGPQVIETFFRCALTKAQSGVVGEHCDSRNVTIAGRMILTQREGTAATKTTADRTGAIVSPDGKLVASQAAPDTHTFHLLSRFGEKNTRSTSFKYENGVMCATFPEMGVTLNSMVDRRQLATRYAILVEVGVNIGDQIFEHSFQSLPFLIAITNDQTEPLLNSIIWSRMLDREHYDGSEPQLSISYGIVREACKQFVKSQLSQARSMTDRELLHFQAMLFLPKVLKCRNEIEIDNLECMFYLEPEEFLSKFDPRGSDQSFMADIDRLRAGRTRLRMRLLEEFVKDHVIIEKHDFMGETCVSILDGRSELRHTPWQWLFKATELILDVGHKLCPSPAIAEKKSTKTKKQLAAAEEYHTMMSLYNKGIVSFFSVYDTKQAFEQMQVDGEDMQDGGALMLRFCDENAGHISFVYGLDADQKLMMGSIAGDTIKDFKQGLSEALMDEEFPARHGRLVRMNVHPDRFTDKLCSTIKKRSLFNTYQSLRQIENKTPFPDEEITYRVNAFTGGQINREQFKQPLFPTPNLDSALSSTFPFISAEEALVSSLSLPPPTQRKRGRKPANQNVSTYSSSSPTFPSFPDHILASLNSSPAGESNGHPELELKPDIKNISLLTRSSPPRSIPSPKSTAASPFAYVPQPTRNGGSNGQPQFDQAGMAAMLEQPMFQNMLSQIMQQTFTQMFNGGLETATRMEEPSTSHTTMTGGEGTSSSSVFGELKMTAPQSLEDILRATETSGDHSESEEF